MEKYGDIRKVYLSVIDGSDDLYKMVIVDESLKKIEVKDKEDQERILETIARENGVSVEQLLKSSLGKVEVFRIDDLITDVDVYVNDWEIDGNNLIEKIVVTTSGGKKTTYDKFADIMDFFVRYCKQECSDICLALSFETRISILSAVKDILKLNIIRPIYKRIDVLEMSNNIGMSPSKIRVVTENHGEQVYSLYAGSGRKLSDTNPVIEDNYIPLPRPNGEMQGYEKLNDDHMSRSASQLSLYDLRISARLGACFDFFIDAMARQLLLQEGVTKETVGIAEYNKRLEEKIERLEGDSERVVFHPDFYKRIEILEYKESSYSLRKISKIRVVTATGKFELDADFLCSGFIDSVAKLKGVDEHTLMQDSSFVVDLSEVVEKQPTIGAEVTTPESNETIVTNQGKVTFSPQGLFGKLKCMFAGLGGRMVKAEEHDKTSGRKK